MKRAKQQTKPVVEAERGALATIRGIQAGTIEPTSLSETDRQRCVEHMTADGLMTAEVAEILKVSERTVARDRAALRIANAIECDPKQTSRFIGQLVNEAELAILRIRRASRDKTVQAAVKVDAEHRCFEIYRDLITKLQSVGYLPTATQQLNAELTHHVALEPSDPAELEEELARLNAIRQTHAAADPEAQKKFEAASQAVLRLSAAVQVEQLSIQLRKEPDHVNAK